MKKFLLVLLILVSPCFAAQDYYQFTSGVDKERFNSLTTELRCLVCQNQNLAESNAPLAADLRDQVYSLVQKGQSNQQIVDYLVARYGDFILYRPPLNAQTIGLWFGPFLLLILAVSYLFYYVRKKNRE